MTFPMRLIWIDYLAASWKRKVTGSRRTTRKQECKKEWRVLFVLASARTSSTPIVSQICRRARWGRRCRLSASWSPPKNFGSDQWQLDIRVSWKTQKWDVSINPKFFSCLMVYRSSGKKSFSDSDMFSWVELNQKFGIWAFSAIFVLFFWVAKNLIYIGNAFNGYSYLKSTRKELSDVTLLLKKEYRLAR